MKAIANFKKRHEAERAKKANVADAKAEVKNNPATENEALTLLAALLGCSEDNAIQLGTELLEKGHALAQQAADFAAGKDKTVTAQRDEAGKVTVTEPGDKEQQNAADLDASAANVDDAAANVAGAADAVNAAAETVSDAAGGLDATANQLAYSADDIGTATAELKEATAELKKPLAGRQSSRGKTTGKPAASSKKSG